MKCESSNARGRDSRTLRCGDSSVSVRTCAFPVPPPPLLARVGLLALAALLAGGGSLRVEAVEYWAPGVNETSGWHNTFQFRNGCWAGCSTDMVAWWQARVSERYDTSGMKIWDREDLIREYDTNPYFGNGGDYVWRAIEWVMTNTVKTVALPRPGTYQYLLPLGDENRTILYVSPCYDSKTAKVEAAILGGFTNGTSIAAISSRNHVWTVYGVGVDSETGKVTHIWATDPTPDDIKNPVPKLHRFTAVYSPYGGGSLFFERGIYDPENNAWNQQLIEPEEVTFLSVDDKYLIDKDGKPSFPRLPSSGTEPGPEHAAIGALRVSDSSVELVGRIRKESGYLYELISTTDIGAPAANWQKLEASTETTADGRALFRHARDANERARFYRLRVSRP